MVTAVLSASKVSLGEVQAPGVGSGEQREAGSPRAAGGAPPGPHVESLPSGSLE